MKPPRRLQSLKWLNLPSTCRAIEALRHRMHSRHIHRLGFKKVGLLGTRVVIDSHYYGVLDGVIAPTAELLEVHSESRALFSEDAFKIEQLNVSNDAKRAITNGLSELS